METWVTLENDCDVERRLPRRKRCCGAVVWGFVGKRCPLNTPGAGYSFPSTIPWMIAA
ncbi:hypothetical protein CHAN_03960 [Corynebacterium hansenii]|nr:hypothetical protein CHAN_03960 [Corynebacterium hansenii]